MTAEHSSVVERARFVIADEIGMARAELLSLEGVHPLRRVVLRERVSPAEAAHAGRVVREETRLDCDDWLRPVVEGTTWPASSSPHAVGGYRSGDPLRGLTPAERQWAESTLATWRDHSGRGVPYDCTIEEDTLVVLRSGERHVAVVAGRAGIILGWFAERTWWSAALALGSILPSAAMASPIGLRAGLVGAVVVPVILFLALLPVVWPYIAQPRMLVARCS